MVKSEHTIYLVPVAMEENSKVKGIDGDGMQ